MTAAAQASIRLALAVAFAASVVGLSGCTGSSAEVTAPSASSAGSTAATGSATGEASSGTVDVPPPLTTADAVHLAESLAATDPDTVVSILPEAAAAGFRADPKVLVPSGSRLDVHSERMVIQGTSATVPASLVSGTGSTEWVLLLVAEKGIWKVFGTRPG